MIFEFYFLMLHDLYFTFFDEKIEMKGRILQLVNDSINTQVYGKVVECLKALQEGCMRETESKSFNVFMHKIKENYEGKRRDDFWRLLVPNGLTLIHCDEVRRGRGESCNLLLFKKICKKTENFGKINKIF